MYLTRFKLQVIMAAIEVKNSPAEHCFVHTHTRRPVNMQCEYVLEPNRLARVERTGRHAQTVSSKPYPLLH
jgi:hypothetical protein